MGGTCGKRGRGSDTTAMVEESFNVAENGEISFLVGDISDIKDDKLLEVNIFDNKSVLVARHGKDLFAIGAKCPHAGAPLSNGILRNGKIRCPWHAACFDLKTGDLEDFPGFDCIPSYRVSVCNDKAYLHVDPVRFVDKIQKPMKKLTKKEMQVVLIGSGPSAYACAQTLREEGYEGRIVMVTKDSYLPYDRTKLSKALKCKFDDIKIRNSTFFHDNEIEVILNSTVESIDVTERSLSLNGTSRSNLAFDFLYIAVGLRPKHYNPRLPGDDLKNIYTLHSLNQCMEITDSAYGTEVVLIGSSFISMELAELLSPVVGQIHILSRSQFPYGTVFGNDTGKALLRHLLQKLTNVTFHEQVEAKSFTGNKAGEVSGVNLTNSEFIRCQTVVIAIGAKPNTEFLVRSQINLHPNTHSILVNERLETNCNGIFAGGDAANFPFDLAYEERGSIAHWQLASLHGRIAAENILGRNKYVTSVVPFFWTNVCGLPVRYLGYGEGYDETLLYGRTEDLHFCIVYRRKHRLVAVCCVKCDNLAAELASIFQENIEWRSNIPSAITERFKEDPVQSYL